MAPAGTPANAPDQGILQRRHWLNGAHCDDRLHDQRTEIPLLCFDGEAHLDGDLPLADATFLDAPPGFDELEPAEIAKRTMSGGEGAIDGVFDRGRRCAGQLNGFINVV